MKNCGSRPFGDYQEHGNEAGSEKLFNAWASFAFSFLCLFYYYHYYFYHKTSVQFFLFGSNSKFRRKKKIK